MLVRDGYPVCFGAGTCPFWSIRILIGAAVLTFVGMIGFLSPALAQDVLRQYPSILDLLSYVSFVELWLNTLNGVLARPVRGDNGLLKWKLDIATGEKREIWFEFYIEFPRDKNISGI